MNTMQRHKCLQPQRRPASALCGCWSPPTAVVVHNRRQCRVRAASPIKEQQHVTSAADPKKLPAMPQLPQRPAKGGASSSSNSSRSRHSTSSSSSSRGRSSSPRRVRRPGNLPMPPIPPPEQQQHAQERTLAGLLAYSGLLGTLATGISMVCPDVDLFGGFNLNPADITLGLQLLVPCCLLNLAIMLPDYSSWKVPAEPTLEAQQKMAEALLTWTANKKAAADAAAAVKASTVEAAAGSDISNTATSADAESAEASTSFGSSSSNTDDTMRQVDQEKGQHAQPVPSGSSNSSSTGSSTSELAPPSVTPPWMINNPDPPLPLPLARCKDALLMAQGHYLSATPRVALPWPMQVVALLVNCLAAELLYRSVVLQVSGGWLTDRILEAGAEDWFQAAAAQLPVLPTPHMTGQLVAVALLSGAWGIAVARQVLLMSRRPSLVMASQGKLAAGKLLDDVQRLAGGRSKQQRRQDGQQDQQQGASQQDQQQQEDRDVIGTRAPALFQQASSSKATASKSAADLALAAAAAEQAGPDPAGAPGSGKRSSRKGFSTQLPNTFTALALSQMVQGVRDLSQSAGLGLAFALTGNLAAPFFAAVVTEGLMAVLQRRGQERSRQRSIAFAKHFASFTRVFRDVQRQQQLQQGADLEQQQESSKQQHQAVAQPAAHPASTHSDAADSVSDASGSHLDSTALPFDNSNGEDVLDAAVAAAVAPDAAVLHAAAAAASDPGGPAGGASGGNTRMERTISVLDQLLGEQLTEQAAAGE